MWNKAIIYDRTHCVSAYLDKPPPPLLCKRRGQRKRLSDEFGYMRTFIFCLYGSILAASYLRYTLKDISGWGREDAELEVRLMKYGVRRQSLKFAGAQYHLFHKELDRSRDAKNIEILNRALASPEFRTPNGIVKTPAAAPAAER